MATKSNLTLAIEQDVLDRARMEAARRKQTLTSLVREYLTQLAGRDREREKAGRWLVRLMRAKPASVGKRSWTRDDLHER